MFSFKPSTDAAAKPANFPFQTPSTYSFGNPSGQTQQSSLFTPSTTTQAQTQQSSLFTPSTNAPATQPQQNSLFTQPATTTQPQTQSSLFTQQPATQTQSSLFTQQPVTQPQQSSFFTQPQQPAPQTNSELTNVLSKIVELQTQTLKLNETIANQLCAVKNEASMIFNRNCDGCKAYPIVGPLHKALNHLDYDLCSKCYKNSKPQGYIFVEVTSNDALEYITQMQKFCNSS